MQQAFMWKDTFSFEFPLAFAFDFRTLRNAMLFAQSFQVSRLSLRLNGDKKMNRMTSLSWRNLFFAKKEKLLA